MCSSDLIRQGFRELFNIKNNTLLLENENIFKELNEIFKPCTGMKNKDDIAKLESTLTDALIFLAQYNYPYPFETQGITIPGNPAKVACQNINATISKPFSHLFSDMEDFTYKKYNLMEKSVKDNIKKLKVASDVFFNTTGSLQCLEIGNSHPVEPVEPNGWEYLACTEMIMPMETNGISDMFNPEPWDLNSFANM